MLRKANETKRQIIEQLNKRLLKEDGFDRVVSWLEKRNEGEDTEEEWIPDESEQKNIDSFNEPKRWQNLKILTDKAGNKVKTRTIDDGGQLYEYPDGSWGFNDPREKGNEKYDDRQRGRDISSVKVEKDSEWVELKSKLYGYEKSLKDEELQQHIKNLNSHIQELVYMLHNK